MHGRRAHSEVSVCYNGILVGREMSLKLRILWLKRSASGVTNIVYVRFEGELQPLLA